MTKTLLTIDIILIYFRGMETRIPVLIRLSPRMIDEIDDLGEKTGQTRTAMIRMLLAAAIDAARKETQNDDAR